MHKELEEFLRPREERLLFGNVPIVVRELPTLADFVAAAEAGADGVFEAMVKCVFLVNGDPVFSKEDLPTLKAASKPKLLKLMSAINRVNGFDMEENEKKSEAAPGPASS